jgi:soluble lytic murein transglycosylase-like protein
MRPNAVGAASKRKPAAERFFRVGRMAVRRRSLSLIPVLGAAAAAALHAPARAQVIEVGGDGQVSVYDRPAVFTDAGATPIQAPAPPDRRPAAAPSAEVRRALTEAADAYALSPALVEAVARQESGLRHEAMSPKGAAGVMQLMPGTARDLGVDRFDLKQNVAGGAAYLSQLIRQFGGDLTLGLAAYNAGPAAVMRWRGVPPYPETRNYVAAVMNRLAASVATPAP